MKNRKKIDSKQNSVYRRQNYPTNPPTFLDKLEAMKIYGKKEVFWTLSKEKLEQIEEAGFRVEPYIYKVRTKRFSKCALAHGKSLLKSLHYGAVAGKSFISCKLKNSDLEFLRVNDISYKVQKYRIIINP